MGLGKTITALAVLIANAFSSWQNIDKKKTIKQDYLIVCPVTIAKQWLKEADIWTKDLPFEFLIEHLESGLTVQQKKKMISGGKGSAFRIVVTSYEAVRINRELFEQRN